MSETDADTQEEADRQGALASQSPREQPETETENHTNGGSKGSLSWITPKAFSEETDWYDEVVHEHGEEPDVVYLEPPKLKSRLGVFGQVWQQYRHHRKLRRLAGKGYVRWYCVEDSFPAPKFVKPKKRGAGVRELKYNGERYLFPREAMLADRTTGMWTVIHRAGELDPIALHEPAENSLSADKAQEWLTMRVSSSAPSLFDRLDIDRRDAMTYLIVLIVVFALFQQYAGGMF